MPGRPAGVSKNIPVESHAYSSFEVWEKQESVYIPGGHTNKEIGIRCPSCQTVNKTIGHGKRAKCKNCSLQMERWGNGLSIWREHPMRPLRVVAGLLTGSK